MAANMEASAATAVSEATDKTESTAVSSIGGSTVLDFDAMGAKILQRCCVLKFRTIPCDIDPTFEQMDTSAILQAPALYFLCLLSFYPCSEFEMSARVLYSGSGFRNHDILYRHSGTGATVHCGNIVMVITILL